MTKHTLDSALKEAEVIVVLIEAIEESRSLPTAQMCFRLNHSDLLDLDMDFCRINIPLRRAVNETPPWPVPMMFGGITGGIMQHYSILASNLHGQNIEGDWEEDIREKRTKRAPCGL